tara:strand:+ start:874 stop:1059 length:186 start_codon:yes stop_codon:yes gene_type:complete
MIFLIKNQKTSLYLYEYVYDIKEDRECQIYKIFKKMIILDYEGEKIYKNISYIENLIKNKK